MHVSLSGCMRQSVGEYDSQSVCVSLSVSMSLSVCMHQSMSEYDCQSVYVSVSLSVCV